MSIHINSPNRNGFITLAPAIIIAAILFVLTVQANLESLITIYQFDTDFGKVQSNRVVDSCFSNAQYKVAQGSLVATSTYIDVTGDYTCQGSVTGQATYAVDLTNHIFGATSTHSAMIGQNFIENEEKI